MAERSFAAVLFLLFSCFLYIAASDILHLIAAHDFASTFILLFCVVASLGWMIFLAALALAGATGELAGRPAWKAG